MTGDISTVYRSRLAPLQRSGRAGFTLIELLITAGIVGLVVAAGSTLTFQVTEARQRLGVRSAHHAEADAALSAIADALRHNFRNPAPEAEPPILFEGLDDEFDMRPADRLRFFRASDRPVRGTSPESDVHEVEFWLQEQPEQRYPALMRRTDPTRNDQPDGGGVVDRLAVNIVALDFTYFDGERWTPDWPAYLELWPAAVRVRLSVALDLEAEDDHPAATRSYTRLIYLPWMPEPDSAASTPVDTPPHQQEESQSGTRSSGQTGRSPGNVSGAGSGAGSGGGGGGGASGGRGGGR